MHVPGWPGRAGPGRVMQNSIVISVFPLGIPILPKRFFFESEKVPLFLPLATIVLYIVAKLVGWCTSAWWANLDFYRKSLHGTSREGELVLHFGVIVAIFGRFRSN